MRTLYYRLLRLLLLGIQPLFVFDGPKKPPFKRNKKTGFHGASLPNYLSKQLLKLFGFPFHTAPGEAEAECALLQKEGIVDAVMSEDVDTLMFGSTTTLRNWSSEGTRGNKSPTHVNVYTAEATKKGAANLDSDGMILIALMSGGDYVPAGIPRCGIKTACEAARAGFGQELCRVTPGDKKGLREFRERLQYELETNYSGFFRSKHTSMKIPDNFPDLAVLGYYTRPVVSSPDTIVRLTFEINWAAEVDIPGLRHFSIEAFEWGGLSGAKKFVRGLAPALLGHRLRQRSGAGSQNQKHLEAQGKEEKKIVASICGRRSHFATDATPELRVVYTPIEIVGLDLRVEEDDSLAIEVYSDSEPERADLVGSQTQSNKAGQRKSAPYDPALPEKLWVLETYVKLGVPIMYESWEEAMRLPKKPKAREKTKAGRGVKNQEVIAPLYKILKSSGARAKKFKSTNLVESAPNRTEEPPAASPIPETSDRADPPPRKTGRAKKKKTKILGEPAPMVVEEPPNLSIDPVESAKADPSPPKSKVKTKKVIGDNQGGTSQQTETLESRGPPISTPKNQRREYRLSSIDKNPWTLSKRPPDTLNTTLSSSPRYSALGIYGSARRDGLLDETEVQAEAVSPTSSAADSLPSPNTIISPTAHRNYRRKIFSPEKHDITKSFPLETSTSALEVPSSPAKASAEPISISSSPVEPSRGRNRQTGWETLPVEPLDEITIPLIQASETAIEVLTRPSNSPTGRTGFPSEGLGKKGKLIMLRESLDGAWRTAEPWETKGKYVGSVFKEVEEVDLTSSP